MPGNQHQHSLRHNQDAQQQQAAQHSSQAGHRADLHETADHVQHLEGLRAELKDRQQQLGPWHAAEREQLAEQQSALREQLGEDHGTERRADHELVKQFQQSERDELQQRQQLEQDVLKMQAQTAATLSSFLQRQDSFERLGQNEIAQRQATVDLAKQRSGKLEQRFDQQIEKLGQFQELVEAQRAQERRALEQALQARPGPPRWEAIQAALLQQESGKQLREQQGEQLFPQLLGRRQAEQQALAAQIRQAAPSSLLEQKFSQNADVRKLWEQAVAAAQAEPDLSSAASARKEYEKTMARFITRLTRENDEDAKAARKAFEDSGLKFLRDEQSGRLKRALPILDLPEIEKQIDMRRHADLLRISGQHLTMISEQNGPQQALNANNLAWMIARDNMQMDIDRVINQQHIDREIRRLVVEEILNRQA